MQKYCEFNVCTTTIVTTLPLPLNSGSGNNSGDARMSYCHAIFLRQINL